MTKISDSRTLDIRNNISVLFLNKAVGVLISLQTIPITLQLLDVENYGIWLTLSSVISWFAMLDLGLSHGFRNAFVKARAENKLNLAVEYLSTTYAILCLIFGLIFIIFNVLNRNLDWVGILGSNVKDESEIKNVITILVLFLSLQMILGTLNTLLVALQKPALSSTILTIGQFASLAIIYTMTLLDKGELVIIASVVVGGPVGVLSIATFILFKTRLKEFSPSLRKINFRLYKDITILGGKFFVIQISMLIIFHFTSIILLNHLGSEAVVKFTITQRYFSILYVVMSTIFMPFWSAFTEAYSKKEYDWMKKTYKNLSLIWFTTFIIFPVMLLISPIIFKYWLAKEINIDLKLSVLMGINMISLSRANLYMSCLNGIGKVKLQMFIYIFFAVISIPIMNICVKYFGISGIVGVTSVIYITQSIFGHIQLNKILLGNEKGIWSR